MFEIFADKMRHIKDSTIRFYAYIICQFIIYSPSVDLNDDGRFIMFKFKLNKNSDMLKFSLKGYALDYYKSINRFLTIIYCSEYSVLCPDFFKGLCFKWLFKWISSFSFGAYKCLCWAYEQK